MSLDTHWNAARFMWSHPAHALAMGFGAGLSPKAPGTVGTLWAWAAYVVLGLFLSTADMGWLIAVSLPVGWWACTVTAQHMQVQDPSAIVWDENTSVKRSLSPLRSFSQVRLSLELFNVVDRANTISYLLVKDFSNTTYLLPNRLTPRLLNLKLTARW